MCVCACVCVQVHAHTHLSFVLCSLTSYSLLTPCNLASVPASPLTLHSSAPPVTSLILNMLGAFLSLSLLSPVHHLKLLTRSPRNVFFIWLLWHQLQITLGSPSTCLLTAPRSFLTGFLSLPHSLFRCFSEFCPNPPSALTPRSPKWFHLLPWPQISSMCWKLSGQDLQLRAPSELQRMYLSAYQSS